MAVIGPLGAQESCVPQARGYVRSAPGGTCRVGLPGTAATVQVPDGWVCESQSTSTLGDETARTLSCIPVEGGSPVSLERMFEARRPASLETFLHESIDRQAELPAGDGLFEPRMVDVAGKKAVETAQKSVAHGHGPDGGGNIDLVWHTLNFENEAAFYQCKLMTSPGYYTKQLQRTYRDFCASIRFDGTANPSGNH